MTDPTEGIPFVREAPQDPAVLTAAELGKFFEVAAGCSRAPVRSRNLALFLSARGTRISIRAVESMIARIRKEMGSAKHITPHTMRHTAATLTLSLGTDLSTVAELLRHSDINTTRRYLPWCRVPSVEGAPPTWVERLLAWTGIDADRCARCGAGRLVRQPLDGRPTPSSWDTS